MPEVQDPTKRASFEGETKRDERARKRESGVMHCEKIRYLVDSPVFLLSIFLSSSFSFVSFCSRVTPTFCHRLVKLRKAMEQRILRLTSLKVINVTCTRGKLECFRCYANTQRLLLSFRISRKGDRSYGDRFVRILFFQVVWYK